MKEGHLYTEGIVGADYVNQIKQQIANLPADAEIIIHHIKSPGGNVYAAWKAIPELMKIGKPIRSMIEGEASSIASWIAVAPAFEVHATDPSTAMIHEPFFPEGITGAIGVDDLEVAKTELAQIRQAMAEAYAKKSGGSVQEWLNIMKKNTRLTADMMKSYGLVDKVIPLEPTRIAAMAEEIKTELKNLKTELMNLFNLKKTAVAVNRPVKAATMPVKALDVQLADGTVLTVDAPNEDSLIGSNASINGMPAPDGDYPCMDGDVVTVVSGVVTGVQTPQPNQAAQPDVQKQLQKQVQELVNELNAIKAKEQDAIKAKTEQEAKAKAEAEKVALSAELEAKKKETELLAAKVAELEKQPAGNQNKPFTGMTASPQPVGFGQTSNDKKLIMATRTYLADEMPWLEKHYAGGKYSDGTTFASYRSGGPNAISILETNFNYTWNGILTTDLFFKPTLSTPALSDLFTVDLGASHQKKYNLVPALSNVLQPYFGCTTTPNTDRIQITNTTIQLKEFRMYEGWCKDDFTGQLSGSYNFLAQQWLKTGEASFDPAGTPIDKIIVQQLKDALRRDVFQRVSFAADQSSSTNYNQFSGLWDRLIDSSGASNYCVYRYGNALGVGTLSATAANDYFVGIFNNSNALLKEQAIDTGEGAFYVTRSIWENYYTYVTATGAVAEQEYLNYLQGIKRLTFRGIPIIPITFWDQSLLDTNNPFNATTRHLILFTLKRNHILGVEDTGDLNNITSWYEMKDSKRYYRADMKLGYQYLHCDLQTISY